MIVLSSLCQGLLSHPEAAGLVPGKGVAETPMCALLLGWAQRECFLMSPEIRSCCLMPWRRAWAPATFLFSLQCLCLCPEGCTESKISRERQAQGLILARGKMWPWPAGVRVEEERHLQTFKRQRHSPWGGCLPFCPPMAAKKICKEMQGMHYCYRALAFPTCSLLCSIASHSFWECVQVSAGHGSMQESSCGWPKELQVGVPPEGLSWGTSPQPSTNIHLTKQHTCRWSGSRCSALKQQSFQVLGDKRGASRDL